MSLNNKQKNQCNNQCGFLCIQFSMWSRTVWFQCEKQKNQRDFQSHCFIVPRVWYQTSHCYIVMALRLVTAIVLLLILWKSRWEPHSSSNSLWFSNDKNYPRSWRIAPFQICFWGGFFFKMLNPMLEIDHLPWSLCNSPLVETMNLKDVSFNMLRNLWFPV